MFSALAIRKAIAVAAGTGLLGLLADRLGGGREKKPQPAAEDRPTITIRIPFKLPRILPKWD